jgi:ABC-2 type transport system ATP-binding protein
MIRFENVTRLYDRHVAVDDLSFRVEGHGVIGLLGPNGAGKTTTMRMITGYLMPSRGDVWIGGHNMAFESLEGRRLIGYLPEMVPLYGDMTTRRYLEYAARLRGLDGRKARMRAAEVAERCALDDQLDVIVGRLSKGYRQRVGLAQAIVHEPAVLVLDEPTAGIDPVQVTQTRRIIRELGAERTVLLSTHILSEASALCGEILIIDKGRLVAQGGMETLSRALDGAKRIRLAVGGPPAEVAQRLRGIESLRRATYEDPYHILDFAPDAEPQAAIARAVIEGGWPLTGMEVVERSLEEVFLHLTGETQVRG